MIFEIERGRRRTCVPFGGDYRGLRFDEIKLEREDLAEMLETPEHELKSKVYDLLTVMEDNERGRRRGHRDRSSREYYDPSGRDKRYAHSPSNTRGEVDWWAEKVKPIPNPFFTSGTGESGKDAIDPAALAEISAAATASFIKSNDDAIMAAMAVPKTVPKPDASGLLWIEED